MRKHALKSPLHPIEAPRQVALLMRRRNITKPEAERIIRGVRALGEAIGSQTSDSIAAWCGATTGSSFEFVDDLVAAGVLAWDEDKELVQKEPA